ncbi:MAG: EMC3/TMCO1 family protein [Euryarchaeota archaeon]|nr:EMC3/TMCO1 family protein [Euryarchaeota archaeon]
MGIINTITEPFYGIFNSIFGGFFPPQENAGFFVEKGTEMKIYTEYILGIVLVAAMVSFFITIVNYYFVDYDEIKKIRKEVSDFRSKLMKAKRQGNKKIVRKLEVQQKRINSLNAKMTSKTMKPMLLTMPLIFIFFAWFRQTGAYGVPILQMPFNFFDLPVIGWFFGFFHGDMAANHLGAYGLYFLCAMTFGQFSRKLLNMV